MYAFGDVVEVIPAYGIARPCRKVNARFAMRAHHEACTEDTPRRHKHVVNKCLASEPRKKGGDIQNTYTHVKVERDADDGQQPQDAVKPADATVQPLLRWLLLLQGLQKEVEDVDREHGDAIQHERLERIRADLCIAARITVS